VNRILRIVINASAFNAGWLACVLASRWGAPLAAIPVVTLVLGLHVVLTPRAQRAAELRSLGAVAAVGTVVDTGMLAAGVLRFEGSAATFVLWIAAFWVNFAALLNVSLRWLRRRWLLAAVLGAVGAPGTYLAGEQLGALALHESRVIGLGVIAVEWAVLLPLVSLIGWRLTGARREEPARTSREATPPGSGEPAGRPAS